MAAASSKDIQDLTKSIHNLIKSMGTGKQPGKPAAAKDSSKSKNDAEYIKTVSKLWEEADAKRDKAAEDALDKQQRSFEIEEEISKAKEDQEAINENIAKRNKEFIKASEVRLKNEKSYGTELYKELDVKGQISDIDSEILDTAQNITKARKSGNAKDEETLKVQLDQLRNQKNQYKGLQDQTKESQKLNKVAAERLKTFKSITDAIKNPLKAFEKLGSSMEESIGKRFNASLAAPKKSIMEIATSGIKLGIVAGIGLGIKRAMHLNQELVDMQRSLGVTSDKAHDIHTSLQDASMASKVLGANQKDYNEAFSALEGTMGTNVANQQKILDSQVLLTKQFGMSNDEAKEFQMTSIGTGKSAEENLMHIKGSVEEYNKLSGDSLSVREIQQDIAKSSKSTLANYKGDVTALTRAVIQAKKLGMTMAETEAVSNSLLDFESSIEAEMKASVMTGQHINMNKARELALMGDTAGAAAEALKQAGSFDKFQKMDVLQKKAVADAAGMTVEQIMKAGQLEKMNSMFGVKSLKNLSKAEQQRLVTQKIMSQEEIDKGIRDEQAASAQEKMNTMIDKMYTLFDQIASGPIEMLVSGLGKAFEFMGKMVGGIKKFVKTFMPEGSGGIMKAAVGIGVGAIAVKAAFKKVKEFFGAKLGEKGNPTHTIVENLKGGGGMGEGGGEGGDEDDIGGKAKKGLKGAKRLFKAFKKGGIKGLMKSAGRMFKQSGGIKGIAKSAMGIGSGGMIDKIKGGVKGVSGGIKGVAEGVKATVSGGSKVAAKGAGAAAGGAGKSGLLGKLGAPLKVIGKFLGPILAIAQSIGGVANLISSARESQASGKKVDSGKLGKDILKEAAYPIVNGAINFIPGFGTAISIADGILGMFGWSPIKWVTDHLLELIPNDALSGLGNMALGGSAKSPAKAAAPKALAVKDALIRPGQPPVTFDKGDLIMAGTNLEGGAKGAGGGGGSSEIASLLKQLIAKVDQPVHFNIGGRVMDEIEKQTSLKKTYTTKTDRGYSAFG